MRIAEASLHQGLHKTREKGVGCRGIWLTFDQRFIGLEEPPPVRRMTSQVGQNSDEFVTGIAGRSHRLKRLLRVASRHGDQLFAA